MGEYVYRGATKKQKQWILERDGVDNSEEYNVHHIIPVAYAIAVLGMAIEDINVPENLIALPVEEHRALHKPPHELGDWETTHDPYWHDQRDEELKEIARIRTMLFEEQGKKFPGKR